MVRIHHPDCLQFGEFIGLYGHEPFIDFLQKVFVSLGDASMNEVRQEFIEAPRHIALQPHALQCVVDGWHLMNNEIHVPVQQCSDKLRSALVTLQPDITVLIFKKLFLMRAGNRTDSFLMEFGKLCRIVGIGEEINGRLDFVNGVRKVQPCGTLIAFKET